MLIFIQNVNYTHFILNLLHIIIVNRLFQLIWACLVTHNSNFKISLNKPLTFICCQKSNFILHVLLKTLQKHYKLVILGNLRHIWLSTTKAILSTCRKLLCLSTDKKSISSSMFFWRYCKDVKLLILGYLSIPAYAHPK